jgi:protein-S-isoprenylcysteine O-methyltransferase Ste14
MSAKRGRHAEPLVCASPFRVLRDALRRTLDLVHPEMDCGGPRSNARAADERRALALMIAGAAIMVRCVFDFAWTGRGTPAPFDPPRHLVVRGLYRWVRNPMYVGMGTFLIGEALALPAIRREMIVTAGAAWVLITAFILLYEEPTLRRLFGADYVEYCSNMRRWIPRLTPFDKPSATDPKR